MTRRPKYLGIRPFSGHTVESAMTYLRRDLPRAFSDLFTILGKIGTSSETGTYVPVVFKGANIDVSEAKTAIFHRFFDVVQVSGALTIDATAAGAFDVGLTLPISTPFSDEYDATGVCSVKSQSASGVITADPDSSTVVLRGTISSTSSFVWNYFYQYMVKQGDP